MLNVFDRTCNLVNQDGEIVTLLGAGMGMNPIAVLLEDAGPAPFRKVAADAPVLVRRDRLTLNGLQVQLEGPESWNPCPDWPAVRQALRADATLLNRIGKWSPETAPAGSLLDQWSIGSRPEPSDADMPSCQAAFLDRVRRCGSQLVQGLTASSPEVALIGARGLAGLGGGLTPAGDDFIVGALLAAWAGLHGPEAVEICPAIAEASAPHTTSLSAAYLRAAARGECMERWHRLFAAICMPDEDQLRLGIGDLMAVGHTSGADALAGFLASSGSTLPAAQ